MSDSDELDQRREFENYLIRKAWKDEAFRKELMENPSETFIRELKALDPNAEIEGPINLKVVAETSDQAYLVLPLNTGSLELSEADLDHVVGGGCGCKNQGCSLCTVRIKCDLSVPTGPLLPAAGGGATGVKIRDV